MGNTNKLEVFSSTVSTDSEGHNVISIALPDDSAFKVGDNVSITIQETPDFSSNVPVYTQIRNMNVGDTLKLPLSTWGNARSIASQFKKYHKAHFMVTKVTIGDLAYVCVVRYA